MNLVKIGFILADMFHHNETGTNVSGASVAWTNCLKTVANHHCLVKIRWILAEIFHHKETLTNFSGTKVAGKCVPKSVEHPWRWPYQLILTLCPDIADSIQSWIWLVGKLVIPTVLRREEFFVNFEINNLWLCIYPFKGQNLNI